VSVTVEALRDIGVDARGLIFPPQVTESAAGLEIMPVAPRLRPLEGLSAISRRWKMIVEAIHWSDMVHWHFGRPLAPGALDLFLVKMLTKGRLVEFWGSDIRIPEVAAADNPYVARLGKNHEYGDMESYAQSRRMQSRFARAGFACLVSSEELLPYVQRDLFPGPHFARQRILPKNWVPNYPDPDSARPLVAHSPSAVRYKGSPSVLAAVEELQQVLDFEFVLNSGRPRGQALRIVGRADIFLDQFVGGGYGVAAIEAMALGKPVVCYIKPSLQALYPLDLPIVNANQDNLATVLECLLKDGQLRAELGRRSRAYVERHHDAHKIAHELIGIYRQLL